MRRLAYALGLGLMLVFSVGALTRADAGIDGGTNALRASVGLAPLRIELGVLAQGRAQAISLAGGFVHNFDWWDASGCAGIGENIAWITPVPADISAWAVRAWTTSPAHYANMVGDFEVTGSATVIVGDTVWAAQLFGKDCGGVVQPPYVAPVIQVPQVPVAPVVLLPNTATGE